jgi:hypothetical protein
LGCSARKNTKTECLPVKTSPAFTIRWDGADFLCMIKELPCVVQECREKWNGVAREQIAGVKYEAIDPDNGETETDDVDATHDLRFCPVAEQKDNTLGSWVQVGCEYLCDSGIIS